MRVVFAGPLHRFAVPLPHARVARTGEENELRVNQGLVYVAVVLQPWRLFR